MSLKKPFQFTIDHKMFKSKEKALYLIIMPLIKSICNLNKI